MFNWDADSTIWKKYKMIKPSKLRWNTLGLSWDTQDSSNVFQHSSKVCSTWDSLSFGLHIEKDDCGNITLPNSSNTHLIIFGDTLLLNMV